MIDRFSEDIDITFNEHIGESRRKKLKNVVLKGISEELGMPVANWEETQSDRENNVIRNIDRAARGGKMEVQKITAMN